MPLLDHFHPPLADQRHWESFHSAWASEIMALLNQEVLPPGYFAETQVHLGTRVIDVASFEETPGGLGGHGNGVALETVTATDVLVMPAVVSEVVEIQVFRQMGGAVLVGAIELVSPGNKDRPESRRAFAAKCSSYLQQATGLLIVDVVTSRRNNLHDELVALMDVGEAFGFPGEPHVYAVSYRPVRGVDDTEQIEAHPLALQVEQNLPVMPLALRNGPVVALNLETAYMRTRGRSLL